MLTALTALASCNGRSSTERVTNRLVNGMMDGITGAVDDPIDLTFADSADVVDVRVKNISGDVVIRGQVKEATGDTLVRVEPRIDIRSANDPKMQLEKIKWVARLDANDSGGHTLLIEISCVDPDAWFVGADIEVDVARLGAVTVNSRRGKIIVDDNRGPVDLSTTRGEIRVRTPWPMTQPCAMVNKDADINWSTRGESSGEFDCETVGGNIISYCRYGRWIVVDKRNDMNSLHATLNGGKNPIVMRNVDGDIRIKIVEDPHNTGTFHWP
ncbi:MAG: hypothetical protein DWI18_01645 [Planctomycetota bacterium]|nr:MAG: hypothetical protein DWI18_01645 [Planctomycetota bacterium]